MSVIAECPFCAPDELCAIHLGVTRWDDPTVDPIADIRAAVAAGQAAGSMGPLPQWAVDYLNAAAWDETKHPRHPRGTEAGGEFAPKTGTFVGLQGYERGPGRVTIEGERPRTPTSEVFANGWVELDKAVTDWETLREQRPDKEQVPVSELVPTQDLMSSVRIAEYVQELREDGNLDELLDTVRVVEGDDGRLYIADGHNRLAAAIELGHRGLPLPVIRPVVERTTFTPTTFPAGEFDPHGPVKFWPREVGAYSGFRQDAPYGPFWKAVIDDNGQELAFWFANPNGHPHHDDMISALMRSETWPRTTAYTHDVAGYGREADLNFSPDSEILARLGDSMREIPRRHRRDIKDANEMLRARDESLAAAAWDESKHPRHPKGSEAGGEFAARTVIGGPFATDLPNGELDPGGKVKFWPRRLGHFDGEPYWKGIVDEDGNERAFWFTDDRGRPHHDIMARTLFGGIEWNPASYATETISGAGDVADGGEDEATDAIVRRHRKDIDDARQMTRALAAAVAPEEITVELFNEIAEAEAAKLQKYEARLAKIYRGVIHETGVALAKQFERLAPEAIAAAAEPASWNPPTVAELISAIEANEEAIAAAKQLQASAFEQVVDGIMLRLGISFEVRAILTQALLNGLGARAIEMIEGIRVPVARAIANSYLNGLSVPQTAEAIMAAVDGLEKWQATQLARNDLVGIANGGSLTSARIVREKFPEVGLAYKEWLATDDERTRPTHNEAHGQRVPLEAPFRVGEGSLSYPGDPSGPDSEVINCRCTLIYRDEPKAITAAFDETKHPRDPGGDKGGEFIEKGSTAPDERVLMPWKESLSKLTEYTADDVKAGRVPGIIERELREGVAAHARDTDITVRAGHHGEGIYRQDGSLDTILVAHEAGHYVANEIQRESDTGMSIPELDPFMRDTGYEMLPDPPAENGRIHVKRKSDGAEMWVFPPPRAYENPWGVNNDPSEILADTYAELLHAAPFEEPDEEFAIVRQALLDRVAKTAKKMGLPHKRVYRVKHDGPTELVGAVAWDETKHPRDPGGEGGGQFIEKGTTAPGGEPEKSEGHLLFADKWEYLVFGDDVLRAPIDAPIRADVPIRNGARFEFPVSQLAGRMERGVYPFTQQTIEGITNELRAPEVVTHELVGLEASQAVRALDNEISDKWAIGEPRRFAREAVQSIALGAEDRELLWTVRRDGELIAVSSAYATVEYPDGPYVHANYGGAIKQGGLPMFRAMLQSAAERGEGLRFAAGTDDSKQLYDRMGFARVPQSAIPRYVITAADVKILQDDLFAFVRAPRPEHRDEPISLAAAAGDEVEWPDEWTIGPPLDAELLAAAWDETKHRRHPKGSERGGEFAPKEGYPTEGAKGGYLKTGLAYQRARKELTAEFRKQFGYEGELPVWLDPAMIYKHHVAKELHARLDGDPEFEKMVMIFKRDHASTWQRWEGELNKFRDQVNPFDENAPGIRIEPITDNQIGVAMAVGSWAGTSSDENAISLTMQKAAIEEFGLTGISETLQDQITKYHDPFIVKGARSFLRAQYEMTQGFFRAAGVTELEGFRGLHWERPYGQPMAADGPFKDLGQQMRTIKPNPISSYSVDPSIALRFAKSGSGIVQLTPETAQAAVMAQSIPVSHVLSTPFTGFGCSDEDEMVVLGSKGPAFFHVWKPDYFDDVRHKHHPSQGHMPQTGDEFFLEWRDRRHPEAVG